MLLFRLSGFQLCKASLLVAFNLYYMYLNRIEHHGGTTTEYGTAFVFYNRFLNSLDLCCALHPKNCFIIFKDFVIIKEILSNFQENLRAKCTFSEFQEFIRAKVIFQDFSRAVRTLGYFVYGKKICQNLHQRRKVKLYMCSDTLTVKNFRNVLHCNGFDQFVTLMQGSR